MWASGRARSGLGALLPKTRAPGEELGLELIRYDPSLGYVQVFVFRKPSTRREPNEILE
jgi:hypothetical protein